MPSGLWDREEYDKLARYDTETPDQPAKLFLCHQTDLDHRIRRLCAGWVGCHDGDHLLALRLAAAQGRISPETHQAAVGYLSPVPLFASGTEAAAHGLTDLDHPGPQARRLLAKLGRVRSGLIYRKDVAVTNYRVPIHFQHAPACDPRFAGRAGFAAALFDLLGVWAAINPSALDPADLPGTAVTRIEDRLYIAEVTITAATAAALVPPSHLGAAAPEALAVAAVDRALRSLGYTSDTATTNLDEVAIVAVPATVAD